jgi:hypothetical protein
MKTSVALALALGLALLPGARAHADDAGTAGPPDGGSPLIVGPKAGAPAATEPSGTPGRPAPPALDSKRSPMPDRLALPAFMQETTPLAPPTAPAPPAKSGVFGERATSAGGGAKRVDTIHKVPPDERPAAQVPRDSVTRTPEDMLAPSTSTNTP